MGSRPVIAVSIPYRCNETITVVSFPVFRDRCNETFLPSPIVEHNTEFQFLIGAMRLYLADKLSRYMLFQFLIGAMRLINIFI